ncbi:hypothetical protein FACS1894198_1980 [Clostridia bacterium]|nr:hypothetical protein FACS1894198_1980 [Clostridia bacterium]
MPLESVSSAMRLLKKGIDVATHNGANVHSGAFKAGTFILRTGSWSSSGISRKATNAAPAIRQDQFIRGAGRARLHESQAECALKETGIPENLAIEGEGHFMVADVQLLPGEDMKKLHTLHPDLANAPRANVVLVYQDVAALHPGGGPIAAADFADANGRVLVGGGNAVAALLVVPVSRENARPVGTAFGAGALAAPHGASADGTKTLLTRFGDFEWSAGPEITTPGAVFADGVARKHRDSFLSTLDGHAVVGWPNTNLPHPTNKKPPWKASHMDCALGLNHANGNDRADLPVGGWGAGGNPPDPGLGGPGPGIAIGNDGFCDIGFKAVPCTTQNAGLIRIPDVQRYSHIQYATDGDITAMDGAEPVILGKIAVAKVDAPQNLRKEKGSRLAMDPAAGELTLGVADETPGLGKIASGVQELSNVDLVNESVSVSEFSGTYGWVTNAVGKALLNEAKAADLLR